MAYTIALRSSASVSSPGRVRHGGALATPSELKHVVVIAGPSGSGKSTLMGEFVSGRLPSTISEHLPEASKGWLRTTGSELARQGLDSILRLRRGAEGLVIHYDIMRALTRGFQDFAKDPAMRAVIETDAALTVLTVLPEREVLFGQFLQRARNGEFEDWEKKPVIAPLKRKVSAVLHRWTRRSPKLLKEYHLGLLEVYASDRAFDYWTRRWETFLDSVRAARVGVRLVYVAPGPAEGEYPRFHLLRRARP